MSSLHPVGSLPAAPLRAALPRREAAPLGPAIRGFMEGRFGADFGDVRIHAGPESAALCRSLGARALTLGRDILFGAGQYAPACPAGRRLLAHELVHVLQQRAAGPRATPGLAAVGHPLDPCEREADRLADEALGDGLRSAVTPDPAGVARRAPYIIDSGAHLAIDARGARPGINPTMREKTGMAVLHLTKNKEPIMQGKDAVTRADYRAAVAVHITGTVHAHGESLAEIGSRWEFHLIQLLYPVIDQACYAGRTSADGSMVMDFAAPPGKNRGYFLDSLPHMSPYAESLPARAVHVGGGMWQVQVELLDHPNKDVPLRLPNYAANNADNYLYAAVRQLNFLTAFVMKDKAKGDYQILCHLPWQANWYARCDWSDDGKDNLGVDCLMETGGFWPGESTAGDPTGRGVAALIKQPSRSASDLYKVASKEAFKSAVGSNSDNDNVKAEASWSPSVRPGFFR